MGNHASGEEVIRSPEDNIGVIELEMKDYGLEFFPGDMVEGNIHTKFEKEFNITALQITLQGREITQFSKMVKEERQIYEHMKTFYNHTVILANFNEHAQPSVDAQTAYPFSIQIPSDLPASVTVFPMKDKARLMI